MEISTLLLALFLVAQTLVPSVMLCSADRDMSRMLQRRGLGLFLILITIEVIVLWYMPSNVFRALFAGAMFGPTFEAFEGAVDHVMNS